MCQSQAIILLWFKFFLQPFISKFYSTNAKSKNLKVCNVNLSYTHCKYSVIAEQGDPDTYVAFTETV